MYVDLKSSSLSLSTFLIQTKRRRDRGLCADEAATHGLRSSQSKCKYYGHLRFQGWPTNVGISVMLFRHQIFNLLNYIQRTGTTWPVKCHCNPGGRYGPGYLHGGMFNLKFKLLVLEQLRRTYADSAQTNLSDSLRHERLLQSAQKEMDNNGQAYRQLELYRKQTGPISRPKDWSA